MSKENSTKKQYQTPLLQRLGTVAALTAGGTGNSAEQSGKMT